MQPKLKTIVLAIIMLSTLMISQPVFAATPYAAIDLGTLGGARLILHQIRTLLWVYGCNYREYPPRAAKHRAARGV